MAAAKKKKAAKKTATRKAPAKKAPAKKAASVRKARRTGPNASRVSHITEAQRKATKLSKEELAQQAADEKRERAELKRLDNLTGGRGRMAVDDEQDALTLDGPAPATKRAREAAAARDRGVILDADTDDDDEDDVELGFENDGSQRIDTHDALNNAPEGEMFKQPTPADIRIRRAPGQESDRATIGLPDDALATAFGATVWRSSVSFDWCRDTTFGRRHTFTRYFAQREVVVDLFPDDSDAVRKEVAEKSDAIRRRNEVAPRPLGYLPAVIGYVASDDEIADVMNGETLELRVPVKKQRTARADRLDTSRATSGDPIADARSRGEKYKMAGVK